MESQSSASFTCQQTGLLHKIFILKSFKDLLQSMQSLSMAQGTGRLDFQVASQLLVPVCILLSCM